MRKLYQIRLDDRTHQAYEFLKEIIGARGLNIKVKSYLMKLYEFEKSKQDLNNIV